MDDGPPVGPPQEPLLLQQGQVAPDSGGGDPEVLGQFGHTHGATVGQLDEEQVFYLRTRGLSEATARDLLTYAFVNDIVERVKLPAIREQLENRILADQGERGA